MSSISYFISELNTAIPGNDEIINKIFPNLWVFIAHIIATIILFSIVIFLAWKPTKRYLESRKKEIQKDVETAEQSRVDAEKNLEISKQKLLDSKTTASHIIENAHIEALDLKKKIEKEALDKASFIEKQTEDSIRKQEKELSDRMNLEVSKMALETAEIFLGKKIDEKSNSQMVDQIVKELEERYKNS